MVAEPLGPKFEPRRFPPAQGRSGSTRRLRHATWPVAAARHLPLDAPAITYSGQWEPGRVQRGRTARESGLREIEPSPEEVHRTGLAVNVERNSLRTRLAWIRETKKERAASTS
jgi:hypothetical protein